LAVFPNHLHTYLKQKSLGTITVDTSTIKPDEMAEKALDLLEKTERKNEEKLLEEFGEKLRLGLAVNGIGDTLKALMMGQVGILLVAEGFTHPGFRCPESGVLVLEKMDNLCPEGKTPLPVVDVVDDAIEEALGQRAEVEVVFNEQKKKLDGIGAILRFKL
jgi:peptide subunit release factor 1 (eRF1)